MTEEKTRSGTFLVGGAVRDALLGRDVSDRDWVVVGKTTQAMLADGYTQVGKDFPVFLHPQSHEEYALARTERKTAAGHLGFECDASPEVTLEDDLLRRDLTVNALAQRPDGTLVDPYGGEQDLRDGVLRHVSPAFAEDPLRILRVARFAAQLGFRVAEETNLLMHTMVSDGALDELPAERVWQEFHKALGCADPMAFVRVLKAVDGLAPWFAELEKVAPQDQLFGRAPLDRYGSLALLLDVEAIASLGERIKAPKRYQRFAQAIALHADTFVRWRAAPASSVLTALQSAGALQVAAKERRDDFLALLATLEAAAGEFEAGALVRLSSNLAELGADEARRAAATAGRAEPQGPELGRAIATLRIDGIERAQADR